MAHVIAIGSGKGGVGQVHGGGEPRGRAGRRPGRGSGLLDGDIYGPNLPRMLGVHRQPSQRDGKILPVEACGLRFMSMGLLVDQGEAVVWRGPMLHGAIKSFLHDVDWGELDYLLVDLPPGHRRRAALADPADRSSPGAVIVTTPSTVAIEDAVKAVAMFDKLQVPVLGVIENMSYFVCPDCHARHDDLRLRRRRGRARWRWGCRSWARSRCTRDVRIGGDSGPPGGGREARQRVRARAARASPGSWRSASRSRRIGEPDDGRCARSTPITRPPRRPAPEVVEAMRRSWASASATPPRCTAAARRRARRSRRRAPQVAALIGALPEEIVFTASGSEANNLALKGAAARGAARAGARLVVSAIEHPSVLETARHLESRGFPLTVVPVGPDGVVDPERARARRSGADVALVSVMAVNNEIGTIQPVRGDRARWRTRAGALLPLRRGAGGGQAADRRRARWASDLLSARRAQVPRAARARRRCSCAGALRLVPLVHGGHQERSRRAGTENLPAIVGLGVAAERARRAARRRRPRAARRRWASGCVAGLLARVPGRARSTATRRAACAAIVNLCFAGVDGEAVLHELDRAGITVSTGSACSAASPGPSHVLIGDGAARPRTRTPACGSRWARATTTADVDRILEVTPAAVERLRALGREPGACRPAAPERRGEEGRP